MDGLAITLISSGAWFVYCAVTNRAPIRSLLTVIKDPAQARQSLKAKENKIDPNVVDVVATAPLQTNSPTPLTWQGLSGFQAIPVSGTPTSTGSGADIVAFARSQIGKPYKFGGNGSDGTWDCSGLTQASLAKVGVTVSHSALAQLTSTKGKIVAGASVKNVDKLKVGDIIFPSALPQTLGNHVAVYSGNGNIIEAPYAGQLVRERAIYPFLVAKRFTLG